MKKIIFGFLISMLLTSMAWAGTSISVSGSTTVLPVAQKVAEAFMKDYPDYAVTISGGGSGNGLKAIIEGSINIAMSSRFIKQKEVEAAVAKKVYPVPFAIAYDCIVPVVHPSNKVKNLTKEQLKDIYLGKITNWKEVGGDDKQIVVVSRDSSSGTYEVWEEKIMQKERVTPKALLQASNGAVMQVIKSNQFAIGYVGIGYLDATVNHVNVEGVTPSAATALSGAFPISRALYLFTLNWPEGETMKFIQYMMNPAKGQKLVKEAGFVPLY